jgi:hypothetical protein
VIEPSASDDPHGGPCRITYGMRQQRLWPPEQIKNLPDYHGLVFMGGARPQPVWLPRYFMPDEFPELRGRYDADPYHPSSSPASMVRPGRTFVALSAAAAIGGGIWLSHTTPHLPTWPAHASPSPVVRADPPRAKAGANPPKGSSHAGRQQRLSRQ